MPRPAHADADATRRRLVDAALHLFAGAGFHGVGTRDLADAAAVNIATIRYHFGDKQGLYDAAVDEVYARLAARIGATFTSAPASLDEAIAGVYTAARTERDGVRLLLREVLDHGRLSARTESRHFLPGLEQTADAATALLGVDRATARAAMVALSYLVSRYVVQEPASLRSAFGVRTVEEAHAEVVRTLTHAARGLLAPSAAPIRTAPTRKEKHR